MAMAVDHLPSPVEAQAIRVPFLIPPPLPSSPMRDEEGGEEAAEGEEKREGKGEGEGEGEGESGGAGEAFTQERLQTTSESEQKVKSCRFPNSLQIGELQSLDVEACVLCDGAGDATIAYVAKVFAVDLSAIPSKK